MRVLAPGPSCSSPDAPRAPWPMHARVPLMRMREPFPPQGKDWMPVFALLMEPVIPALLVGGKRPRAWGWRVVGRSVHTHRHTHSGKHCTHTHTALFTHIHTVGSSVHTHTHTPRPWTVTCQELGSKSINKRFHCDLVILVLVCSLSATQINPPFWSPLRKGFIYQPDPSVTFVPANLLLLLLRTLI